MHGRWRFRLAREDGTGEYVSREGVTLEHFGTDVEALALAQQLTQQHPSALHIEAVSVGLPTVIIDTPGRLLVRIEERKDQKGWMLHGDLMSCTWHPKLIHAVSYAASRTRGNAAEIRLVNRAGKVTHVVLIDTTTGWHGEHFLGGPKLGP